MSGIGDARAALAAALENAGFTALEYVPARVNPPLAVIMARGTYVEPLERYQTGSEFALRLVVRLIATPGTNERATAELDQMIDDAIVALDAGYGIESVGEPTAYTFNNTPYLASDVTLTTTNFTLGGN